MIFGRWTVKETTTNNWLCECECGTQRVVRSHMLHVGKSRSCGCLHREIVSRQKASLEERLWAKINKRGPDECWLWMASLNAYGYGQIQAEDKSRPLRASRVVYETVHGSIPKGMHVLHHCDNPACCNPKHLWLGTHQDNMDDMNAKGRNGNVGRKLTPDQIARRQATRWGTAQ